MCSGNRQSVNEWKKVRQVEGKRLTVAEGERQNERQSKRLMCFVLAFLKKINQKPGVSVVCPPRLLHHTVATCHDYGEASICV